MKRLHLISALVGMLVMTPAAFAANAPANIVYPINGGAYNNYFTASFGATCSGGAFTAKWGFDGTSIGSSTYYGQLSVQFSHKLPSGAHTFFVATSCGGYDTVQFTVL